MSLITLEQLLREEETMYLSDKPRPIDFYKPEGRAMMIEVASNGGLPPPQHHQMILAESSGEDLEMKAPKKRAETWAQEETRSLIGLRREMDGLFNTSKSNKHLWEQISVKMRDKGFDRSPTMCTDKWRNLLKEFKKAKHLYKSGGTVKLAYYKEIDELLKDRSKNGVCKNPMPSKVDSYLQFSEKGLEDASIPYNSTEASARSTLNLERRLDHDGHPLAITTADAVASGGIPPWNWRDTSTNGQQCSMCRSLSPMWILLTLSSHCHDYRMYIWRQPRLLRWKSHFSQVWRLHQKNRYRWLCRGNKRGHQIIFWTENKKGILA